MIEQVYELDPHMCSHCGGEMRFLAVIEEALVIERLLQQEKAWDPFPLWRALLYEGDWPDHSQIPLSYHPSCTSPETLARGLGSPCTGEEVGA